MLEGAAEQFPFDEGVTYLNHGGFGVTPRCVSDASAAFAEQIRKAPAAFYAESIGSCQSLWHESAALTAKRFGADPRDLALVLNTTDGINAVFRSLRFDPGDEILMSSHIYGAIEIAAQKIFGEQGVVFKKYDLSLPHQTIEGCVDALQKALTPKTKLVYIDHIACGFLMPVAAMVKACRATNSEIRILVDGAHVPGNVHLNLSSIGADWYVANLHKWYFAPPTCGFLWAARDRQNGLTSTLLSWEANAPFPASFDWPGTMNATPWLSIPAAFDFMDRYGEEQVFNHNHELARQGAALLEDAWGVKAGVSPEMLSSMAFVPLPDGLDYPATEAGRNQLESDLWRRYKIHPRVPLVADGRIWIRISAQIYNKIGDYEKLAEAVLRMKGRG